MIKFSLICDQNHRFDSWFQSAQAFDRLQEAGCLSCAICGSSHVEKALMAPRVQGGVETAETAPATPDETAGERLDALRRRIEARSDYVGLDFVREARDMHDGLAPSRNIHGEARIEEARQLIADGVPVAPLPFLPRRKVN